MFQPRLTAIKPSAKPAGIVDDFVFTLQLDRDCFQRSVVEIPASPDLRRRSEPVVSRVPVLVPVFPRVLHISTLAFPVLRRIPWGGRADASGRVALHATAVCRHDLLGFASEPGRSLSNLIWNDPVKSPRW